MSLPICMPKLVVSQPRPVRRHVSIYIYFTIVNQWYSPTSLVYTHLKDRINTLKNIEINTARALCDFQLDED